MDAILIVDDSITTVVASQKLIAETFPKMKIIMASAGDEALKMVETTTYDIVLALIDYHMEDINGVELMVKLQKKFKLKNTVIVTGDDSAEVKKEVERRGGKVLSKPLTKEGLLSVAPKS
jgi:CheY-like chemotaxis protein